MVERQLDLLKGPRQRGKVVAKGPSEFQIQCAIVRLLRVGLSPGWLCNAFPAGELRTEATGARLKASGLKPGWPDMIFIGPNGQHCWLEIKREKGKLREDQAAFALEMIKRSVPHAVAHSVEEALAILQEWGAVRTSLRISV